MTDQTNSHLPLTEATFFILLSLTPDARHGYAILKDVQALSEGRITLSTGTLYGALDRLLDLGWIERLDKQDEQTGQRPRKYYQLSEFGRRILKAETSRMKSLVSMAQLRAADE